MVIGKNKELSLFIHFNPSFPGNYNLILDIKHSDGNITCLVFTEAFYADLRMIELDGKSLLGQQDSSQRDLNLFEMTTQKEHKLDFLACDYDKSYTKTVIFKNFTNQTLRFEWVQVQQANQVEGAGGRANPRSGQTARDAQPHRRTAR